MLLLLANYTSITREQLIKRASSLIKLGVRSVVCWGENSSLGHISFDLANIEQPEFEAGNLFVSTADFDNSKESFEEALWYTLNCATPDTEYWDDCSTVVINLAQAAPQADLENCLHDFEYFEHRMVGT